MLKKREITRIAGRAVESYGNMAALEAARRTRLFLSEGDYANGWGWLCILDAVKALQMTEPVPS